ncbi:MAG: cytochrome c oxidase assembly protein [Zoogloeaceae bacterium]|nr:cytochrome c oxidase assembly protein [Rhodocyclaceae bacterium]MCP5235194.1 cytochrome c oxidase assembly protein [Zoogloeaceae bacterium]
MSQASENRALLVRLAVGAIAMFGFGFALVPFYEKICEVAGINDIGRRDDAVVNTQVDTTRTVTIEFDTNLHDLAWQFRPLQRSVTVHPGELVQVAFEVVNNRDYAVAGQAIPSYGPRIAGAHVRKLDCFCFSRQTLEARERRVMPVVFVVDADLPGDVNTMTLSYTFFEVAGTQADVAAGRGGAG